MIEAVAFRVSLCGGTSAGVSYAVTSPMHDTAQGEWPVIKDFFDDPSPHGQQRNGQRVRYRSFRSGICFNYR